MRTPLGWDADPPWGALLQMREVHLSLPQNRGEIRFEGRMSAPQRNPRFRLAPRTLGRSCGWLARVRLASDCRRIIALQRNDATCQTRTSASYSITSSAVASSVCDTVRPSAFAALRLITSSNLLAPQPAIRRVCYLGEYCQHKLQPGDRSQRDRAHTTSTRHSQRKHETDRRQAGVVVRPAE